jgi:signal transduction histidine kinase
MGSALVATVHDRFARAVDERLPLETFERVLQSVDEGVLVEDGAGAIVWANGAAAYLAGVAAPSELIGCRLCDVCSDLTDDAGSPLAGEQLAGARLLRGEHAETTIVRLCHRASGRVSWASVRASLVDGGALAVSVWRDVTVEWRRVESARYLARATAILSESLDYEATLKRLATVLVPEIADWYHVDVLEGGELHNIAVEHSDPAKLAIARELHARGLRHQDEPTSLCAIARTGRSVLIEDIDEELLVTTSQGDAEALAMVRVLAPRSIMMVPLKAREQTLGAMKLGRSDSGRRYDEADLATAEELGRRVGMAIENTRAYREAREASRLRDEFLTIAGHELRTPLTALKLEVQAMTSALSRCESPRPEGLSTRAAKSLACVDRLHGLIERLLDVSLITSGRLVLDREHTDLAELWRGVIDRHRTEASRTGSIVSFTSSGDTMGHWDRARLDQVLASLLGNALKYGQGKPVRVSLDGSGGAVRTVVEDDGPGIELCAQARLFGRFERAVSVRNYGGFGLGLWIVRELVEAHGGTVGFESEPGCGSRFWVDLPRTAAGVNR